MFELDKRLSTCADLVCGDTVGDVGTDHAYLPIFLIAHGKCRRAVAADINEGPVERARENVAAHALTDQITVVRADGLHHAAFAACDSIVIAGMGGELISRIIDESEYPRSAARLILQPMTKAECLRAYLWRHGYEIIADVALREGERIYQVLAAHYTGIITPFNAAQALVGMARTDAEYAALVERTVQKLTIRIEGKHRAGADAAEEERLIAQLKELL